MSRSRERMTHRKRWNQMNMTEAMEAVLNGETSVSRAALVFNIPLSTLRSYLVKYEGGVPKNSKPRSTFTNIQEEELKALLTNVEKMSFGITWKQCRSLVYSFAERKGIPHKFNRSKRMPSTAWFRGFMKRQNFKVGFPRTLFGPSRFQDPPFGRCAVRQFFEILEEVRSEGNLSGRQIHHAIEIGFSVQPSGDQDDDAASSPSLSGPAPDSTSSPHQTMSSSVTIMCCGNAAGELIPPFLIFPARELRKEFLEGTPPGSVAIVEKTGSLTEVTLVAFLEHFVRHARPPSLLLLDNQAHLVSPSAVAFARQHGIILMGFPRNVLQRLRPMCLTFLEVFTSFFIEAVENFPVIHEGRSISDLDAGLLFGHAFNRAAIAENIAQGFRYCGIEPLNPQIFGDLSDAHLGPNSTSSAPILVYV